MQCVCNFGFCREELMHLMKIHSIFQLMRLHAVLDEQPQGESEPGNLMAVERAE